MLRCCIFAACLLVEAVSLFAAEELRTWKDTTGKFSIEARFVKLADETVHLETAAGKAMKIPLDKLSAADRKFLADSQPAVNPFQRVNAATLKGKAPLPAGSNSGPKRDILPSEI